MAGENCLLTATGFTSLRVKVIGISYGMEVISSEDEGRSYRAYYPHEVIDSSFSIRIKTKTYAEHKGIVSWLTDYGRFRQRPDGNVGAMRVLVASRRFDRIGIPTAARGTSIQHGNPGVARAHGMEIGLDFVGTKDPVKGVNASKYLPPTSGGLTSAYFYPSDNALSGDQAGEDLLYDQKRSIGEVPNVTPDDLGYTSDSGFATEIDRAVQRGGR